MHVRHAASAALLLFFAVATLAEATRAGAQTATIQAPAAQSAPAQIVPAQIVPPQSPWAALTARLAADGVPPADLQRWFTPQLVFDPSIMAHKVDRMVRKQFEPQPAPTKRTLQQSSYGAYLKPWMLSWAADYAAANQDALDKAQARYAVPPEIIVALLLVETKLGTYLGKDNAFQVLASMAASNSLEPIRPYLRSVGQNEQRAQYADSSARDRADWAYQELKGLIQHARASGTDPMGIPGSIYGAIGICQFMPTNAVKFGVDGDTDGRVDLFSAPDAIPSIANYLVGHGWKPGLDYNGQRAVIYAYNHSDLYSLAVMTIAERLRQNRR